MYDLITIDDIRKRVKQFDGDINLLSVGANEIIFEHNIRINCFYCGRYNNNWKCPPRIPDVNYKIVMQEFENIVFVYKTFYPTSGTEDNTRLDSTNHIHRCLLDLEKFLFENSSSNSLSFIGGSCKLCKTGCGKEKCNNPYLARIPVEGTGINVIKTLAKKNVNILFPSLNEMKRVGLLLWN